MKYNKLEKNFVKEVLHTHVRANAIGPMFGKMMINVLGSLNSWDD